MSELGQKPTSATDCQGPLRAIFGPNCRLMIDGMKSRLIALMWSLILMPISASGQVEVTRPMSSHIAEPMHWRDGYITWKGQKISGPDWLILQGASGDNFAIDRSSIRSIGPDGLTIIAVAYFVDGDDFDPNNLISFAFGCSSHFTEVVTKQPSERVQFVEKRGKSLACHSSS